jgi:hypothetical protein
LSLYSLLVSGLLPIWNIFTKCNFKIIKRVVWVLVWFIPKRNDSQTNICCMVKNTCFSSPQHLQPCFCGSSFARYCVNDPSYSFEKMFGFHKACLPNDLNCFPVYVTFQL